MPQTLQYIIPPRPEILIKISEIVAQENPDIDSIVSYLKQDVTLYTAVLATVNNPHLGLSKRISSLSHAVVLLGTQRLFNIVRLVSLKTNLSKLNHLERFWDTATEVAELSAWIGKKFTNESAEDAYTLGMLHDCGLPIMMAAHKDYKEFLRTTNNSTLNMMKDWESERYHKDRFSLGATVAEKWHMPTPICQAIYYQPHHIALLSERGSSVPEATKMLLAALILARDISNEYRRYWRMASPDSTEHLAPALEFLGIVDWEFIDLKEEYMSSMDNINR